MNPTCWIGLSAVLLAVSSLSAQQSAGRRADPPDASAGAKRLPRSRPPQSFPAAQIQAGELRFASQCGFCHGRDAQGGESGPDLTRSPLVAEDVRGDKLRPMILAGRPGAGKPSFSLPPTDVAAIVAFIHDARSKVESANGKRRGVDTDDLQTGNAEAGKQYFNGAGGCARCHSLNGSFATVGARFQGLALLQRMLYPRERGTNTASGPQAVTVTTGNGETVSGRLAYSDEFTVTLVDSAGWPRSFPVSAVRVDIDDPLRAHTDQLGRYTDREMHDVFAYLQSLR